MKNQKRNFYKYILFNILAMAGVSVYILADTYFISRVVGATGLAALNFAIVVFTVMHAVGLMIGIGGAIDFAISQPEMEHAGNRSFTNALFMGMLFSVAFLIAGLFFSRGISIFLGADAVTLPPTKTYITTILGFSPLFILNNIALAFIRNDHNPKLAMTAMMVSSFANILLDYILMFPLSMGIFGAALASGISPLLSLSILAVHFKHNKSRFKLCREKIGLRVRAKIMKIGFPAFIGEFASAITLFTFNLIILNLAGNVGVAAYGIIANAAIIATALFTGLAQGIQPLASRSFANFDQDQLNLLLKRGFITSLALFTGLYLITFIFSQNIVSIFNSYDNEALAAIAESGLKLYFTGFIFAGVNIVFISFLSAIASTNKAIVISLVRSSLLLIPIVLLMSHHFGLTGVWLSFLITEFMVTFLAYLIYKSGEKGSGNCSQPMMQFDALSGK